MLWGSYYAARGGDERHFISQAFESKVKCDEAADKKSLSEEKARRSGTASQFATPAGVFFECLPDTVDPRGPKGR